MRFTPPTARECLHAIGPTEGLPLPLRRALEPGDLFAPIPVPGASDWLANHFEPGQTFEQFLRSRPHRPDARRHRIYLQPLGEFPEGESPSLGCLQQFASAFFALEVRLLPALSLDLDAVIAGAIRTGTALEIDAMPDRLDLCDVHARRAAERGAALVIDTDAHSPTHLGLMRLGVATARRAWIGPESVWNTLSLAVLRERLTAKRRKR